MFECVIAASITKPQNEIVVSFATKRIIIHLGSNDWFQDIIDECIKFKCDPEINSVSLKVIPPVIDKKLIFQLII